MCGGRRPRSTPMRKRTVSISMSVKPRSVKIPALEIRIIPDSARLSIGAVRDKIVVTHSVCAGAQVEERAVPGILRHLRQVHAFFQVPGKKPLRGQME